MKRRRERDREERYVGRDLQVAVKIRPSLQMLLGGQLMDLGGKSKQTQ